LASLTVMLQLAGIVRTLALAFWIGGMAVLDFVDAPARFALLDRNQAVRLGQALFERFNRIELALALVTLAAALLAQSARWTIWLLVVMLAAVVAQATYLTPAITRLAHGLDFVHRAPHDPRYVAIRPLHTAYAVLEIVLFVAGVIVLAVWARPGRR